MRFISQVSSAALLAASTASAGQVLWDGRFNDYSSASDLDKWSFSNPVGSYQYYIHGAGKAAEYVALSSDFKNPADAASQQGVRISLTDTAFWNGQNMRRTELIPETQAAINQGKVYYHFSMKRSDANAPSAAREHQIAFFESHFTEMKAGLVSGEPGAANPALQWFADGTSQWKAAWEPEVWHNVAYEIDFDAGTVGFWHSTGADALKRVVAPVKASTSSNGADWHLGVLELPKDGAQDADEDIFFSGVYIESGDLTTEIGSGGSGGGAASKPASATTAAAAPTSTLVTSAKASTTTAAASSAAPSSAASATTTTAAAQTSAAPKPKCRKRKARRSQ